MKSQHRSFWIGVAASLVAAAIVGLVQFMSHDDVQAKAEPKFEGTLGDQHHEPSDGELIDFVLDYEGEVVNLDLHLGPEIAADFAEIDRTAKANASRTYHFALSSFPKDTLLMDLVLLVEQQDDFFFAVESPGTGRLRGRFRIVGCAQTGSGWFACEMKALKAS